MIYLDNNATTPLDPRVARVMVEELERGAPANPSSLHGAGRDARSRLERAREQLAGRLAVDPSELTFTSGGTESNNLALLGVAEPEQPLFISAIEHPSVREAARRRWAAGAPGGELPVDGEGRLDRSIRERGAEFEGALVSIQWVNNEVGTIQALADWAAWFHEQGALVHTDGAQGFFRLPDTIPELGVDLATITAHKSFGPTGVGALWVRRGVLLDPLLRGGPQEKKVRAGTENLPAIIGMGALAALDQEALLWADRGLAERLGRFRAELAGIDGVRVLSPEGAFPTCVSIAVADCLAETILVRLDLEGVAASSGSACSSGAREPSHVLAAMGVPDREIRGAIRLSAAPSTTEEELSRVAGHLARIVADLRRRPRTD